MRKSRLYTLVASFSFLIASALLLLSFTTPQDDNGKKATAGGELTFTIRTVTDNGPYSPKHVLAIWIEHDGDFVKTRKAMANQRKQYLYTWKAASNYNVVDAITGATLTSHQTHTVTWDCTDLEGNILPDGDYTVFTEFTDQHAQGPLYSISFTKGPDAVTMSPADETYFKDIELEFTPFVAEFSADINTICQWGTVTFTDESVNADSWEWDFGDGAAPATATAQGPHTVYYTTPGIKTVTLTINGSVTETKDDFITVNTKPTAAFSFTSNALTVDFTNESVNATSYLWDFDDGNTSTENNPTHTYASAGAYNVTLHASYMDCEDYESKEVIVPLVGLEEVSSLDAVKIFPNPNTGVFTVDPGNISNIEKIGIFAAGGKFMPLEFTRVHENELLTVDLSGFESGIYFLRIESKARVIMKKVIIR